MLDYNPKEWITAIFSFHKEDTVRKMSPAILWLGIYSTIVAVLILEVYDLKDNNDLRNISIMHSLLGFVISFLLVFRNNTAYDRWWEGRKSWGTLVNASRTLSIKIDSLLEKDQDDVKLFYQTLIPDYAIALKNHLRNVYVPQDFILNEHFSLDDINKKEHVPNQIAGMLYRKTIQLQKQGYILPENTLLINQEIQEFTNVCGACERIKNTPIPYSYSSFLKKFLFLYLLTLPIGYVFNLHYLVIPCVMFITYVLGSLEVIAEEIEDPFGTDANDLPLDQLCTGIRKAVYGIFGHINSPKQAD
jgi:putative membrane protein